MTRLGSSQFKREELQRELLELFKKHGVSVGVGLTKEGVAIRTQDDRVNVANVGRVEAF